MGSASQAFDFLLDPSSSSEASLARQRLQENTLFIRQTLTKAGFTLKGNESQHPIVPIMIYDAKKAGLLASALLKAGIYAVAFSYPVVPKGIYFYPVAWAMRSLWRVSSHKGVRMFTLCDVDQARIRLQVSAAHSREDLERAVAAIIEQGHKLGLSLNTN